MIVMVMVGVQQSVPGPNNKVKMKDMMLGITRDNIILVDDETREDFRK